MSYFYFNWNSDCQFGNGIDVVTGKTLSTNPFKDPSSIELVEYDNGDNDSSTAHNEFVESSSSYISTVDEAMSVSGSAWGGSLSGSAEYISESTCDFFSIQLMGYDHVELSKALVDTTDLQKSLQSKAKKLLKASADEFDPQAFFDTYGAYFISGYIKGGIIIADYKLKFSSQTEMDSLSADLESSYSELGFSAEMDASISEFSKSSSASFSTEANCQIYGGTNAGSVVVHSCEGINEAMESFSDDLGDGDKIYAIVQPWTDIPWVAEQLKDWDGDLDSIFYNDDQNDSLSSLSTEYSSQLVIKNTAQQIINNREYTFQSRLDMLNNIVSDCQTGMTAITDYIKDPSQIPTNPNDIPSDLMVSASIYDELNSYLSIDYYTIAITYNLTSSEFSPTSGDSSVTIPMSDVESSTVTYVRLLDTHWSKETKDSADWRLAIKVGNNQLQAEFKQIDNSSWDAYGATITPADYDPGTLESSESKAWPAYNFGKDLPSDDDKYDDHYFTIKVA